MSQNIKLELKERLGLELAKHTGLSLNELLSCLERPKNPGHGDLAFPAFSSGKLLQIPPTEAAKKVAASLNLPSGFSKHSVVGPFINFHYDRPMLVESVVTPPSSQITPQTQQTTHKTYIVEYSSPNIAKPFHVGHLRSTLIGNCLDKVLRYLGHTVISINHLGDWGTQFGFVWAGCSIWGKPSSPTVYDLVDLYRRATSLKEQQEKVDATDTTDRALASLPNVSELARGYFLDLEAGQEYAVKFWRWCLEISLQYFKATYQRMGISFDHYTGESFYSDKLEATHAALKKKGLLQESQGAWGVDLGEELGFARISTPDGRSLYLTRDLAAALYRAEKFQFNHALYVVGAPQTLHFQQLKEILRRSGEPCAEKIVHVAFGHVLGMKTRGGGEVVELNEFLDEAKSRALQAYHDQVTKRPPGLDEDAVATGVSLAAIIFADLSRLRIKDVQFSWDHALAFQGDTGPYVLYAYARINGIKEKAKEAGITLPDRIDPALICDDASFALVSRIADLDQVLQATVEECEPAHLAHYVLDLAKAVSHGYLELKVIGEATELAQARLALFEAARRILKQGLELLGITPLERM